MSKRLAWLLVLAGASSVTAGAGLIYVPLAPIVAGVLVMALGLFAEVGGR